MYDLILSYISLNNRVICTAFVIWLRVYWKVLYITWKLYMLKTLHRSAYFQAPPNAVDFHKQKICFLLSLLDQIVTWQYNPNFLNYNWPCTVINDHDWQLRICPLLSYLNQHTCTCTKTGINLIFEWDMILFFNIIMLCANQRKYGTIYNVFGWIEPRTFRSRGWVFSILPLQFKI